MKIKTAAITGLIIAAASLFWGVYSGAKLDRERIYVGRFQGEVCRLEIVMVGPWSQVSLNSPKVELSLERFLRKNWTGVQTYLSDDKRTMVLLGTDLKGRGFAARWDFDASLFARILYPSYDEETKKLFIYLSVDWRNLAKVPFVVGSSAFFLLLLAALAGKKIEAKKKH